MNAATMYLDGADTVGTDLAKLAKAGRSIAEQTPALVPTIWYRVELAFVPALVEPENGAA